jgi:hypothetical protein
MKGSINAISSTRFGISANHAKEDKHMSATRNVQLEIAPVTDQNGCDLSDNTIVVLSSETKEPLNVGGGLSEYNAIVVFATRPLAKTLFTLDGVKSLDVEYVLMKSHGRKVILDEMIRKYGGHMPDEGGYLDIAFVHSVCPRSGLVKFEEMRLDILGKGGDMQLKNTSRIMKNLDGQHRININLPFGGGKTSSMVSSD